MENELRTFIQMTYGASAWQDLIKMQARIRTERMEAAEARKRQIKQNLEYALAGFLILVIAAVVVSGIILIAAHR